MKIPTLTLTEKKTHWSHSDTFGLGELEYIKSFIHNEYSIGYHTHSFYELNIVLNGEGYHYIEAMSYHTKPGCVFLIPPYIKHGYLNKSNLNVYHMLIHRDFIEHSFSEFKKTEGFFLLFETEPYLRAHYNENMFLILTNTELSQIREDIGLIEKCKAIQHSNIFINAVAKKILCNLCMLMMLNCGIENNNLTPKRDLINIADCLNYIHCNFDEKLTVELLSKRLNMSRSTFIRQFTRVCGCAPHQYIHEYRIKKAHAYLKDSNMTITEIAQKCGFYDASHLRKYLNSRNLEGNTDIYSPNMNL